MAAKILSATFLLASAISAAALPSAHCAREDTSFRLIARLDGYHSMPEIDGLEVAFTSSTDGAGVVTLVAPGNGKMVTVHDGNTVSTDGFKCPDGGIGRWLVSPGGTATVPSTNTVDLECQGGSSQFFITPEDSLLHYQGGGWMGCRGSTVGLDDQIIALSFFKDSQRPLYGCQEVRLVATSS
ncbi:hypothetical protein DL766_004347 [Monosporascus sp. MC13-8B]|uniref:DUF7907 domain-containing protein n=1 Tax=Monosporascus cannonballus TaxID=155416 RepID=A0ABY0HL48_9PEZI|nr:hypothetical protein DL762_001307 [Monosporascus cannonballus]RYP01634.1 hypothetical protein DL763_000023 [Monosporascus cannonballus]RYP31523.1 hypothetical protein DL766_004347 [Monosporascus sp. MC13-8B]